MTVKPYKCSDSSKKKQVEDMFNSIASRYDLLNHLLSFNIDKVWRRNAINLLEDYKHKYIIDIATGTADFAIEAARLNPLKITGIDLSEEMLNLGKVKVEKRGLSQLINLLKADSEELPFEDEYFDAAIVGFGVRNFENLKKGLAEIFRVLAPGGVFIVLEFSYPKNKIVRNFYTFYFLRVLPFIGRLISGDNSAYSYLPESVAEFPEGDGFISILERVGYFNCKCYRQTFGIASIYLCQKP